MSSNIEPSLLYIYNSDSRMSLAVELRLWIFIDN